MNKYVLLVILVVGLVGGVYFLTSNDERSTSNTNEAPTSPTSNLSDDEVVVVTYTSEGFEPNNVTVKVGDTVRFKNENDKRMWVASNIHPIHSVYSEVDQFFGSGKNSSYDFTFEQLGNWEYHNHLKAVRRGVVNVTN